MLHKTLRAFELTTVGVQLNVLFAFYISSDKGQVL
jgi:hypothetical protein